MVFYANIITEIAETVTLIGILPTALVCGFVFLIKHKKRLEEQEEKQKKERQERIEAEARQTAHNKTTDVYFEKIFALLDKTLDNQRKEFHHEHTKEEEDRERKFSDALARKIKRLQTTTKASRASYISYHNGGFYLNGRSMPRQTMIIEDLDGHTPAKINYMQGASRKMFLTVDTVLADKGHYYIDDIEKIKNDDTPAYNWYKEECGAQEVYLYAVRDEEKDLMLGFIGIEFTHPLTPEERKIVIKILGKTAIEVGGAFTMSDEVITLGPEEARK